MPRDAIAAETVGFDVVTDESLWLSNLILSRLQKSASKLMQNMRILSKRDPRTWNQLDAELEEDFRRACSGCASSGTATSVAALHHRRTSNATFGELHKVLNSAASSEVQESANQVNRHAESIGAGADFSPWVKSS